MKACGFPVGDPCKPLRALEGEALVRGVRIVRELGLDRKYGYTLSRDFS